MPTPPVTVSVVVPTWRRAGLLDATLASLARCDPPPDEVLVASDEWDDGSDAVVARHGARLVDTARLGAAGHRNAGWLEATGEVVAFIDDDCVADPGWVGAISVGFADPAVGLVQGRTCPAGPVGRRDRSIDIPVEYGLYESCNIAYRRVALEAVGGFDETFAERFAGRPFGEDADLAYRVQREGWRTRFAEGAVVRHHVFPGTLRDAAVEEWRRGYFPKLLRLVPEVERILPGPHVLRPQSARAQLLLAGLVVGLRRPLLGAALAVPYVRWAVRTVGRRAAPERAALDLVCSVSMILGSVRARRILL
ncbi:MAG TPA: glycosyltransferase [Acidimicrobiales bacterium]|nr:glycosyltransferase [Acidimicrobiales bacterium]